MFIYCSGDSFTRGSELADAILPNWPGLISALDESKVKQGQSWFANQRFKTLCQYSKQQKAEFYSKETERAWPNKLANILDATVINAGRGGSSQGSTNYRIMIDIERLLQSGSKIDKVFIQITEPARLTLYNRYQHGGETEHHTMSLLPGLLDHYDYNDKMLVKFWDLAQLDAAKLVHFLTEITLIRNYVKSRLGYEPIFVDSLFMRHIVSNLQQIRNTEIDKAGELQILVEASNIVHPVTFESVIPNMQQFEDWSKLHRCPGGHLSEEIHEKFAQLLAKTYF